jgi:predicted DCC family thiol-disulfide oxidoreductase YuxK
VGSYSGRDVLDQAASTAPRQLPVLVFDGDCGFCTTCADWLTRTFPHAFDVVPYQLADLSTLGLTEDECAAAVQWVGRGSARARGAAAVAAALRAGGADRPGLVGWLASVGGVICVAPPISWVSAGAYRWVSANRQRLPGGTPACQR